VRYHYRFPERVVKTLGELDMAGAKADSYTKRFFAAMLSVA
jgi:hypothetical protein